jgi:hypothetical protein
MVAGSRLGLEVLRNAEHRSPHLHTIVVDYHAFSIAPNTILAVLLLVDGH